jgi:hypothetical protein
MLSASTCTFLDQVSIGVWSEHRRWRLETLRASSLFENPRSLAAVATEARHRAFSSASCDRSFVSGPIK